MNIHNVDLKSFISKGGIISDFQDGILHMTTTQKIRPECCLGQIPINSHIYLNDTFKLSVRIDMTVKIDSPEMYFIFGQGHIAFGSLWNNNRRIDDIAEPDHKPRTFIKEIPINEFTDISIIYNLKEMQILINGKERLYSKKEKYMKSELFNELNNKGFKIGLSCTKRIDLFIKHLKITESEDNFNLCHPQKEEIL
jgi:hypothetical protein